MRFSHKKYKILSTIESARMGKEPMLFIGFDKDKVKGGQTSIDYIVGRVCSMLVNSDVLYFSKDISEKIENRSFKFMKSINPFFDSNIDGVGTILLNDNLQICYDFERTDRHKLEFDIAFVLDGDIIIEFFKGHVNVDNTITTNKPIGIYEKGAYILELGEHIVDLVTLPIKYQIFKKHAPIEELLISKENKRAKLNGVKHLNESSVSVRVIDSTWFTNITRLDGFSVKGHFRLQPFGEGRSKRKLIWINDFEKEGYSLKARSLNDT